MEASLKNYPHGSNASLIHCRNSDVFIYFSLIFKKSSFLDVDVPPFRRQFFWGGGEHCEFMGAYFSRLLNDVFFPPQRLNAQKKKKIFVYFTFSVIRENILFTSIINLYSFDFGEQRDYIDSLLNCN